MIIQEKYHADFEQVVDNGTTRRPNKTMVERTTFQGEIDPNATMGECHAEQCADGGVKITIHTFDEFDLEHKTEIILEKLDIDQLKAQGLI